jgi:hypothetical protein
MCQFLSDVKSYLISPARIYFAKTSRFFLKNLPKADKGLI